MYIYTVSLCNNTWCPVHSIAFVIILAIFVFVGIIFMTIIAYPPHFCCVQLPQFSVKVLHKGNLFAGWYVCHRRSCIVWTCSFFCWIFIKHGSNKTCSGVIPALIGCFCENLCGQLQVVFEQQLDLKFFLFMTRVLYFLGGFSVQEKESTSREGVWEGETSAWKSGGERTGPLQERIHRYQQCSCAKAQYSC